MFPICTEQGKVIAFTGRTLATDEKSGPKYLNSPETPIYSKSRVLFNLDKAKEAIRKLDYAILVEGQMDCITVFAAGLRNVIASSGTAFTEAQARLLGRFSKKIVVNFDPDTAGAAAAERSLALLVSEDFEIKVLTLEAGFDPDLYIRRKGVTAYTEALGAVPEVFRLPDRACANAAPGAHSRGQGEGAELSAAAHPARAQPHRARRAGQRNLAPSRHRVVGAASGIAPRRHGSFGRTRQRSTGGATHRRRARAGSRAGQPRSRARRPDVARRPGPRLRAGAPGALLPHPGAAA